MITEGLDYEKHYTAFNGTEISKLEDERRAIVRKIYDLKEQCRHPEHTLQWVSQGRVNLFYCGACGNAYTFDARDSMHDLISRIKRAVKQTDISSNESQPTVGNVYVPSTK